MRVIITREPWSNFYVITLENGHTEELDVVEETKKWFIDRGADEMKLDQVLDHVYNFQRAEIVIDNFREPTTPRLPYAPNL
jgi:hypothetical protein